MSLMKNSPYVFELCLDNNPEVNVGFIRRWCVLDTPLKLQDLFNHLIRVFRLSRGLQD